MQLACCQLISVITQHLEISIVGFLDGTVTIPKYDPQQVRLNKLMQPEFAFPKRILCSPFASYVFNGNYNNRRTRILHSRQCDPEPQNVRNFAYIPNNKMTVVALPLGNLVEGVEQLWDTIVMAVTFQSLADHLGRWISGNPRRRWIDLKNATVFRYHKDADRRILEYCSKNGPNSFASCSESSSDKVQDECGGC